jgi:chromate reductase, NAD(P)H dehydrogenase (quinone)
MGATPGRNGTILAQAAWLPVFRTLGSRLLAGPRLYVSGANKVFDQTGALVDETVRALVEAFMADFAEFIKDGA